MGSGNVCVFGPYEGLYYIDNDDLWIYKPAGDAEDDEKRLLGDIPYEDLSDWVYSDIDTQWWIDDVLETFTESMKARFKGFHPCDKWIGQTQQAILENELFYITVEDNEWSLAVKLLQKEPEWGCDSWMNSLQKRHYQRYLNGIRDALFEQFDTLGIYSGPWTSGRIKREEVQYA